MIVNAIESVGQPRTHHVPAVTQPSQNNAYLGHLNQFAEEFFSAESDYPVVSPNPYPTQLNTTALVGESLDSVLPPSLAASFTEGTELLEAQGFAQEALLYPVGLTKTDATIQVMYPTQLGAGNDIGASYPIQNALASGFYAQTDTEVNREAAKLTVAI